MRPMFPFYGGKWRLSSRMPAPREGDTVVEPFAGGAGYSLRYEPEHAILVERDPDVAAAWEFLISASTTDILGLPVLGPDDRLDRYTSLSHGERALIGLSLNVGSGRVCNRLSSWGRKHVGHISLWGEARRARVAEQVEKVSGWTLIQGDYSCSPNISATWHIDPPYSTQAGRHYRYSQIDYTSLAEWCLARRGRVMVCEAGGADWLPFEHLAEAKTVEGVSRTGTSTEVLWTSEVAS